MIIPILMDHRHEDLRMLVGSASDTSHGLLVSMYPGKELTEDQVVATFGMAGIEVISRVADEGGRELVQEFLIKEFSLCAASGGSQ